MNPRQIQGAIDKCLHILCDVKINSNIKTYHPSVYDSLLTYMQTMMSIQIEKAKK